MLSYELFYNTIFYKTVATQKNFYYYSPCKIITDNQHLRCVKYSP